jgi:hypothetical protein
VSVADANGDAEGELEMAALAELDDVAALLCPLSPQATAQAMSSMAPARLSH